MKTQVRVVDHSVLPGEKLIEIWYAGELIGSVTGADGPGVRIITKHRLLQRAEVVDNIPDGRVLTTLEVAIEKRT